MTAGSHTIKPGSPTIPRLVDLWAYGADGVGHIVPVGRFETRHPCGEPVRAERFRHPATARCAECVGAVGITVDAPTAWTESELRVAHGDG